MCGFPRHATPRPRRAGSSRAPLPAEGLWRELLTGLTGMDRGTARTCLGPPSTACATLPFEMLLRSVGRSCPAPYICGWIGISAASMLTDNPGSSGPKTSANRKRGISDGFPPASRARLCSTTVSARALTAGAGAAQPHSRGDWTARARLRSARLQPRRMAERLILITWNRDSDGRSVQNPKTAAQCGSDRTLGQAHRLAQPTTRIRANESVIQCAFLLRPVSSLPG